MLEAIQAHEHAQLLMKAVRNRYNARLTNFDPLLANPDRYEVSTQIGLTRLGIHALQTNTVRQHLGLGDAPPTA